MQPSTPDESEAVHLASLKNILPWEDPRGTVAFQPMRAIALIAPVIVCSTAGGWSTSLHNEHPLYYRTDFSGDSYTCPETLLLHIPRKQIGLQANCVF